MNFHENTYILILIAALVFFVSGCGDSSDYVPDSSGSKTSLSTDFDQTEFVQDYRNQCESQANKTADALMPACELKYGQYIGADYCPSIRKSEIQKQMNDFDGSTTYFVAGFETCGLYEECLKNLQLEISSILVKCGTYSF